MIFQKLGPIRQVAYVVHDIRAAMEHWIRVQGVGPFFFFEEAPVMDFRYHGEPCDGKLSVAFTNSGSMQIELIQPLDQHPSAFREFLESGGEGQQHIACWTEALDLWVERAAAAGLPIVHTGYTGAPDGRFAYIDTGGPRGTMLEISEVRGRKAAFFQEVAQAAAVWGGSEPVRRMEI